MAIPVGVRVFVSGSANLGIAHPLRLEFAGHGANITFSVELAFSVQIWRRFPSENTLPVNPVITGFDAQSNARGCRVTQGVSGAGSQ